MPTLEVSTRADSTLSFHVLGITGEEAISRPYRFEADFEVREEGGLAPETIDGMLGRPARLWFGAEQIRSGLLTEVTLLPQSGREKRTLYRAILRPRIARTELARGYHVYQDARVPALVAAILRRHGLEMPADFQIAVDPGRWTRRLDYVVQHDETDFAFISRLMERWGLFYFFDEEDGDRVVIGDANAAFRSLDAPLRFDARDNPDATDPNVVWAMSRRHRWLPASVRLTDYNWRAASDAAQPSGDAPVDAATGHGVQQLYGGDLREPAVAAHVAKVRAESIAVDREVYQGLTQSSDIAPGVVFEVLDHPHPELCRAYLVTKVAFEERSLAVQGREQSPYLARFSAIPAEVPYRAPAWTPWPHIAGVTHGFVAGVDMGAAAAIDETGSYDISVPYDLAGSDRARASRPIRKAQPATGPDHGVHLPLHVGVEVALAHIDGDPDRPIIVGAVPNAKMPSPVREEDATKGRIRSRGGVEIQLDDDSR